MRLGQKIAALHKKNHLFQEALAEKMNVSRQAVSKWESEQAIPDIEKIVALSELFGARLLNSCSKKCQPSRFSH